MIEFSKIREVNSPKRNAGQDAGIDVYVPERADEFVNDLVDKNIGLKVNDTGFYIRPHESVLIPAGIVSKFDNNLALVAMNKSGICTNTQLICGACVIDSSYQGEWHIHVINTSNTSVFVEFGTKLVQFVPLVISTDELVVKDTLEYDSVSERGANGFGSTGIK